MTAEQQAAAVAAAQAAAARSEEIRRKAEADLQRHGQAMTNMGVGR